MATKCCFDNAISTSPFFGMLCQKQHKFSIILALAKEQITSIYFPIYQNIGISFTTGYNSLHGNGTIGMIHHNKL